MTDQDPLVPVPQVPGSLSHDPVDTADRQRDAIRAAAIGVWEFSPESGRLWWNDVMFDLFGVDPATFAGVLDDFRRCVHADDLPGIERALTATLNDGPLLDTSFRIRHPLRGLRHMRVRSDHVVRSGGVTRLLGINEDITALVQERRELQNERDRLGMVLFGGGLGAWEWQIPTGRVSFGDEWAHMLGDDPSTVTDRVDDWFSRVHPDDMPRAMAAVEAHFAHQTPYFECEYRVRHADGTYRWILHRGTVIEREADGSPVRMAGTHLDVTDRRGAQEALAASEARLKAFMRYAPFLAWITDTDGRLHFVNHAMLEWLQQPEHTVLGRTVAEVLGPANAEREVVRTREMLEAGGPYHTEETAIRPDGVLGHFSMIKFPLSDAKDGEPMQTGGFAVDITELRRAEAQLLQAQKLEALGRLAGGIAHDFNNILTIVTTSAELLLQQLAEDHPARADADEILHAADRAAALTRSLLSFSRQEVLAPHSLDLRTVVQSLSPMLERLLGEDVRLETQLPDTPVPILADAAQLEQVLLNLAVNARDAMPGGGALRLIVDRTVAADGTAAVLLEVSDDGIGMDEAVQARIFEPFFTTKPPDQGTGLGLATVYGIVRQSGGSVAVESAPGRGTTFRIRWPLHDGPVYAVSSASPDASAVPMGTETILLAEDDVVIRRLTLRYLRSCGYAVLEAHDAESALAAAAAHAGEIHLLVSDVVMPGASGAALASQLRMTRPHVRVLFVSGWAGDELTRRGVEMEATAFLQKPFTVHELAVAVRAALDADTRAA